MVGALLVINAVLSFMQERRAAGVVEALRKRLQVSARVRRDSSWQVIPARELVPGDIVRVRPGDIIPADVKLLTGALTVDQSALTGESKDADKKPGEVLSSGSVVRRGEGNGVVMLTGAKTYFGRTTELVQQARPKLHIEAVVAKVVRWLFVIVGALLCVVVVLSLIRGAPLIEMVPLMLVLLMSAVPVALPVMFTVSMAVGSKELAKLGVLVTRLSAAEDAATMDVLCVDKTGTITMNQLAVTSVIPLEQATEADVLFAGALASQVANQDPIDLAFLAAAKDRHVFDNLPKVAPAAISACTPSCQRLTRSLRSVSVILTFTPSTSKEGEVRITPTALRTTCRRRRRSVITGGTRNRPRPRKITAPVPGSPQTPFLPPPIAVVPAARMTVECANKTSAHDRGDAQGAALRAADAHTGPRQVAVGSRHAAVARAYTAPPRSPWKLPRSALLPRIPGRACRMRKPASIAPAPGIPPRQPDEETTWFCSRLSHRFVVSFFLIDMSFPRPLGAGAVQILADGDYRAGACGRHGQSAVAWLSPCKVHSLPAESGSDLSLSFSSQDRLQKTQFCLGSAGPGLAASLLVNEFLTTLHL